MQRIVIVGGGAGGLALATRLGKQLGKKGLADITLVDAARTHVWKPLLHPLAAGSLMGSLTKGSFFIEGQIARLMYWALYKQHQLALGGFRKTALITLSELIDRTHQPRIKLH